MENTDNITHVSYSNVVKQIKRILNEPAFDRRNLPMTFCRFPFRYPLPHADLILRDTQALFPTPVYTLEQLVEYTLSPDRIGTLRIPRDATLDTLRYYHEPARDSISSTLLLLQFRNILRQQPATNDATLRFFSCLRGLALRWAMSLIECQLNLDDWPYVQALFCLELILPDPTLEDPLGPDSGLFYRDQRLLATRCRHLTTAILPRHQPTRDDLPDQLVPERRRDTDTPSSDDEERPNTA
mgnify:CR=1 FL=1